MYKSIIYVDTGSFDNPAPGRFWLRDRYRVHQRLCMAFPKKDKLEQDPLFLQPYNEKEFENFNVPRNIGGFLFRHITPNILIVQSHQKPNWEYCFQNSSFIKKDPEIYEINFENLKENEKYKFTLEANPTKKIFTTYKNEQETEAAWWKNSCSKNGKRVFVGKENLIPWLEEKLKNFGAMAENVDVNLKFIKVKEKRFSVANYSGSLIIKDFLSFKSALVCGIGPLKGFGCGLLLIE